MSDAEFLPEPTLQSPKFSTRHCDRSRSGSMESTPASILDICSPGLAPVCIVDAREQAMNTLHMCRSVLISLEMTRMSKSRTGWRNWKIFWHRIYETPLAKTLCDEVERVFPKIDHAFQVAAKHLCNLTFTVEKSIKAARTETEIFSIWEEMERVTIHRRELRRERVMDLLEWMRFRIENLPVDVSDELFDDMKRGIFALDIRGDYHPGDPEAEERDRQTNQPPDATEYLQADPALQWRPGFREEFQEAIARATWQENIRPAPLEAMEDWVNTE